jgi:N-acetylglucosamine kinase
MHVLGIDAGGSKTVCLLADQNGSIIAESRGGGANLQSSGELDLEKVLHQVMEQALGDRDIRPAAICLGIAGVDRPRDADAVRGIMRRIGYKSRVLVVNDALIALVAGVGDDHGLVVIAGTGSIVYGRDAAGRTARSGGWGYLLGDEGSAFWMGRAALTAVVRQFDRRGPGTLLTGLVLDELGLESPMGLIHAVYDDRLGRHAATRLVAVVQQAADAGDAVAHDILDRAAIELAAAASAVVSALGVRGDVFRTVLAGGVFPVAPSLTRSLIGRLSELAPRSEVRLLQVEPAIGAVRLALAAARGEDPVPHPAGEPARIAENI